MSYVESNLVAGEKVIYQTELHWIVMVGHLFIGFLLLGLPGALLLYYAFSHSEMDANTLHLTEAGGAALLVCGAVVILIGVVRRHATEMAVTNRRVVIKTGLMSRKTIEMLLSKVESIEVSETTGGRMLGYGTIVVIGTGGTSDPFRADRASAGISKPGAATDREVALTNSAPPARDAIFLSIAASRGLRGYAASSAKTDSTGFFAGVVVITITLISTRKVPKMVRAVSASPPRKYPTSTATIGFTYA